MFYGLEDFLRRNNDLKVEEDLLEVSAIEVFFMTIPMLRAIYSRCFMIRRCTTWYLLNFELCPQL